jgi:hypothetical protein
MKMSRRELMTRFMGTAAGASLFNLLSPEGLLAQAREKAKPFNLKITGLKTFLVAPTVSPGAGIFVKIYTNQGLVGLGLATQSSKEVSTAAAINEFTPLWLVATRLRSKPSGKISTKVLAGGAAR